MLKTIFIFYIIGFIISGLFSILSYKCRKFYKFQADLTTDVLKENNISFDDDTIEGILMTDCKLMMFMSYVGLLKLILYWLLIIFEKYSK